MKASTFRLILFGISAFFLAVLLLAYAVDQVGVALAIASGYGSYSHFHEFFPPLFYISSGLACVSLIAALAAKFSEK